MSNIDSVYRAIDSTHPQLVFINGKTSTGKTTLSNVLQEKYDCVAIELDEIVYGLDCPAGKNRFTEAYQKRDNSIYIHSFVKAVQDALRTALDDHDFAIFEGAITVTETLNEIISEWRDSFLFVYLDLKNIDVYTERLTRRFILSTPDNVNGLPGLFWDTFNPAELTKYYTDQKITPAIKNSINNYAVESIQVSAARLAAFETEFKHILKVEI